MVTSGRCQQPRRPYLLYRLLIFLIVFLFTLLTTRTGQLRRVPFFRPRYLLNSMGVLLAEFSGVCDKGVACRVGRVCRIFCVPTGRSTSGGVYVLPLAISSYQSGRVWPELNLEIGELPVTDEPCSPVLCMQRHATSW